MKYAYLDSSVWINHSEGDEAYSNLIDQSLTVLERQEWRFCLSDAVALEVLLKPQRMLQQELIDAYVYAFEESIRIPAYDDVFRDALKITFLENLKAMDAIHVAFALRYECELFVTTDPHFKNLNALPLHWIDLSQNASV